MNLSRKQLQFSVLPAHSLPTVLQQLPSCRVVLGPAGEGQGIKGGEQGNVLTNEDSRVWHWHWQGWEQPSLSLALSCGSAVPSDFLELVAEL